MKYLTAAFTIAADPALMQTARDLLAEAAAGAGFEAFEDTAEGLNGYVNEENLDREALDQALADFDLPSVKITYTLTPAEDKDWNEEWENTGFSPIDIEGRVLIYDARQPAPELKAGEVGVAIQARQAFGTGTHETTQMIVNILLGLDVKGKRVLDCGCGTGILGIVASKLGAKDVVGYDIDEWSVDNARHNAELNHVDNLEVLHGDASVLTHVCGVFDIVLANINRNILLHDMPAFREMMMGHSTLVLSGFYAADCPALIDKAQSLGLTLCGQAHKGDWQCLVVKVKE